MKYFIYLLLLTLCACGSGEVLVTVETVDYETLQTFNTYSIDGHAIWDDLTTPRTCTIYMLPTDWYRNTDEYHRVLGHEMQHCVDGAFH